MLLCDRCATELDKATGRQTRISYKKLSQTHDKLIGIQEATLDANRQITQRYNAIQKVNEVLVGQRNAAQEREGIQKQVTKDALEQHQAEREELIVEVKKLRAIIKERWGEEQKAS